MSALDDACTAAGRLHDDNAGDASRVGAELANQLQAVSDAVARLDALVESIEGVTERPAPAEDAEILRDAHQCLENVLKIAKQLRGGR